MRLPTLTTRKIRAGIPQPLRGLVWQAMCGARDTHLEGLYDSLCSEKNIPFEKVIERDLMRTFPQVEMFKQEGGEGQCDLGKVLRAFSLYDSEVGYCQGLGFLAAPLLMNMSHQEAFCVLVRIMEVYGMRSMYTSTLAGLKLRLYQFEQLMLVNIPDLAAYFEAHEITPTYYASQWFLSVFAVTCPLSTLHRVYDLFLAEGAPETILRLALTLLIKNKEKLMSLEMEEILQLLLSKDLWSVYEEDDDVLVTETVLLSDSVTTDILNALEAQFDAVTDMQPTQVSDGRGLQAVATSFLGRINPGRLFSGSLAGVYGGASDSDRVMSRTASKMSSLSSESAHCKTDADVIESSSSSFSRDSALSMRKHSETLERTNKQLNLQIEDMIAALGEAHRDIVNLRETNDKTVFSLDELKSISGELVEALAPTEGSHVITRQGLITNLCTQLDQKLTADPRSDAAQLAEEKVKFLESQLDDRNHEVGRMRSSLAQAKIALDATAREKCRLERSLNELRLRKDPMMRAPNPLPALPRGGQTRRVSTYSIGSTTRSPSPSLPPTPTLTSTSEDEIESLRLELVQAKAAIAISQQESEEAKYALRMMTSNTTGQNNRMGSIVRIESAPVGLDPKAGPANWFWRR